MTTSARVGSPGRQAVSPAGGHGPERVAEPGPSGRSLLASAILAALPAVLVTAAVFAWMLARSAAGTNPAGLQMPAMGLQHRVGYWWAFLMGETLGISALIWSYLSVLVGLVGSTRSWSQESRRSLTTLHRYLSMTTIVLIAGHVLFVALGSMNAAMTTRVVNVSEALLPFQSSWNGQYYNTGVFAFYLAIVLGPTYYLRRWIGPRVWRVAHQASLVVYVLAVWHTLGFDDFSFDGPYRLLLWMAQVPLAVLLLRRLLTPAAVGRGLRATRFARWAAAAIAAAVLVVLIGLIASGRMGGSSPPSAAPSGATAPSALTDSSGL